MDFDALVAAGRTESFGEHHFLTLLSLEAARYGVVQFAQAADLGWALVKDGELVAFRAGTEKHFIELLEHPRSDIEAELERSVRTHGLPAEVAWSFPAIDLVRAMIATGSPHFTRVALAWLLPTELRELRSEIQRVADDPSMLVPVRELARRLIVPG